MHPKLMAVLAAGNPHILHWELCQRQSHPSNGGASSSLWMNGAGLSTGTGSWRRVGKGRGEVKIAAFWQDVSRPMSIEMEAITSVEELEQILKRAGEHSEIVIIDWMATWCRKCIYLKPKLEKLAAEFHPRIRFYFVDVNNVPQALVKRGNISPSFPHGKESFGSLAPKFSDACGENLRYGKKRRAR